MRTWISPDPSPSVQSSRVRIWHRAICLWSDADWAGHLEDTKSTFGFLLELKNPNNGCRWPISWGVRRQRFTSNCTAETKTVAVCYAVKCEGLPTFMFLDVLLAGVRRPVELVGKVENTQAIAAVHKGFFQKLKFVEQTHKRSIGSLHKFIESGQLCVDYTPTLFHQGDGFTKCLTLAKFIEARKIMFMISTSQVTE